MTIPIRETSEWKRLYKAVLREFPKYDAGPVFNEIAAQAADQLYLEEKAMREGRFNIPLTNQNGPN